MYIGGHIGGHVKVAGRQSAVVVLKRKGQWYDSWIDWRRVKLLRCAASPTAEVRQERRYWNRKSSRYKSKLNDTETGIVTVVSRSGLEIVRIIIHAKLNWEGKWSLYCS